MYIEMNEMNPNGTTLFSFKIFKYFQSRLLYVCFSKYFFCRDAWDIAWPSIVHGAADVPKPKRT